MKRKTKRQLAEYINDLININIASILDDLENYDGKTPESSDMRDYFLEQYHIARSAQEAIEDFLDEDYRFETYSSN